MTQHADRETDRQKGQFWITHQTQNDNDDSRLHNNHHLVMTGADCDDGQVLPHRQSRPSKVLVD